MAKKEKSNKPAVLSGTVPEWASTSVIAQLLGKTVRRVQQLTQEGVLETELPPGGGTRKYRTCETIQRYVSYVEEKAHETGENSRATELTLKKLEAEVELKESQGQLHRLKTAIAEGRYLPAEQVTRGNDRVLDDLQKICAEHSAAHGRFTVRQRRCCCRPRHGKGNAKRTRKAARHVHRRREH